MSNDLKRKAMIDLTAKLQDELNKPINTSEKKRIINGYVDGLEQIFRHYKHSIKVINNGFYDTMVFISYICGTELCAEVVIIENGNVAFLM